MKLFYILFWILPFFIANVILPATVNGRFNVLTVNSSMVSILIQINTNTGSDDLGGATIVFSFDTTSLSFPCNPVRNVDYIFHNFCGDNYSLATVTKPMNNKIWINIDLPLSNKNNGTVIAGSPGWTNVATINFGMINETSNANLTWNTQSLFWGIYDADNSTLWQIGSFKDLTEFPLPVELSSFTAKVIDSNVHLEWKTSTEVDNYGFEIERSLVSIIPDWRKIGFVNGHGNSNSPKYYSFSDDNAAGGSKFEYRLKQIDNDGDYEYSETVEVEMIPDDYAVYQNFPNPFNPTTKIKYQIPEISFIEIKIYDMLGTEVMTLLNEKKEPGLYIINFDASQLPSGIYFYRLKSGSFVETKKMVLLR